MDLDHKLGANGAVIKVRHVYHMVLSTAINLTPSRLPSANHRYQTTAESCIDLFTRGYPPGTYHQLVGNGYCLGRCAHPAIVNTGD